jgi:hypothetical protein
MKASELGLNFGGLNARIEHESASFRTNRARANFPSLGETTSFILNVAALRVGGPSVASAKGRLCLIFPSTDYETDWNEVGTQSEVLEAVILAQRYGSRFYFTSTCLRVSCFC